MLECFQNWSSPVRKDVGAPKGIWYYFVICEKLSAFLLPPTLSPSLPSFCMGLPTPKPVCRGPGSCGEKVKGIVQQELLSLGEENNQWEILGWVFKAEEGCSGSLSISLWPQGLLPGKGRPLNEEEDSRQTGKKNVFQITFWQLILLGREFKIHKHTHTTHTLMYFNVSKKLNESWKLQPSNCSKVSF